MKKLRCLILSAPFYFLFLCLPASGQKQEVLKNFETILFNTGKMLEAIHYQPKPFNDEFSAAIFAASFDNLDPQRRFFLQSDIDDLNAFRFRIDDEIRGEMKVNFFLALNDIYRTRITESQEICRDILSQPFQFTETEYYTADSKGMNFPESVEEKRKRWYLYTKYQVLNQFEDQLAAIAEKDRAALSDSLEQKSRSIVSNILDRYFRNLLTKTETDEAFSAFVNTVVHQFDPHSAYYLPVDRREFVEGLSGVYYGIGALLVETGGKIGIGELIIGGPAWRSGLVEKGDIIVRVTQENEKPVSVEGFSMQELIKLTRGKKDSRVTITFRKQDGSLRDVEMVRTALHMEDTFVKTALIQDSTGTTGYIFLPKFYTSFGDANGRSCAEDMQKALLELQQHGVDGIIVDIRDNGGGSLGEVIEMVGLFVNQGPVVQVKSRGEKSEVGRMNRKKVYDGPLVIMVNELSASASEIFAGAIQDYQRGVIIGSSSTYGKGTVQRSFRIPGINWNEPSSVDLGTLNLTIQKYYRVTGSSTQLKGVQPDITLPGYYEHYKVREKDAYLPLPWDEIRGVSFRPHNITASLPQLKLRSDERLLSDSAMRALGERLAALKQTEDVFPLEQNAFRKERERRRNELAEIRRLSALPNLLSVRNVPAEEEAMKSREQFRQENNKAWLRNLQKDRYLNEAVQVIKDLSSPQLAKKSS